MPAAFWGQSLPSGYLEGWNMTTSYKGRPTIGASATKIPIGIIIIAISTPLKTNRQLMDFSFCNVGRIYQDRLSKISKTSGPTAISTISFSTVVWNCHGVSI
jgi:hypothetical protein